MSFVELMKVLIMLLMKVGQSCHNILFDLYLSPRQNRSEHVLTGLILIPCPACLPGPFQPSRRAPFGASTRNLVVPGSNQLILYRAAGGQGSLGGQRRPCRDGRECRCPGPADRYRSGAHRTATVGEVAVVRWSTRAGRAGPRRGCVVQGHACAIQEENKIT